MIVAIIISTLSMSAFSVSDFVQIKLTPSLNRGSLGPGKS